MPEKDEFIRRLEKGFAANVDEITRQGDSTWLWDESAKRYRNAAGQFLSRDAALNLALESILASHDAVATIAQLWSGGAIDSVVWNRSFKQVVKDEYIRQYLAGYGGRGRMTPADWGRIGADLKFQYGRINLFEAELANLTDGQIAFRMQMYINSAHQANEKAHSKLAMQWGADSVDWVWDAKAEHCETCARRDAEDAQPIGPKGGYLDPVLGVETWPGAGDSECLTNCRCSLELTNSITGAVYAG